MTASKIEWTDRSDWNPIRGCTRVSPGCGGPGPHGGCYAEAIAARFSDPGQPFHGIAERTKSGPRWTGKLALVEARLGLPMRWKKPARIFVNSMFDLFHESVPDDWIDRVFAVMALAPQHSFQVLTKRAERMRDYLGTLAGDWMVRLPDATPDIVSELAHESLRVTWPLPNVWIGVSVEDQARGDERIPHLLASPAAVRFLSCEPLIGPVRLREALNVAGNGDWLASGLSGERRGLDWVIVGGESGPGARPLNIAWVSSLIAQCRIAGVACFVKQLGAKPYWDEDATAPLPLKDRKGGDWSEWPAEMRVREMPA